MIVRTLRGESCLQIYEYLFLFEDSGIKYIEFTIQQVSENIFPVVCNDIRKYGIEPMVYFPYDYIASDKVLNKIKQLNIRIRTIDMTEMHEDNYTSILNNKYGRIIDCGYDYKKLAIGIIATEEVSAPIDAKILSLLWIFKEIESIDINKSVLWWKNKDCEMIKYEDVYGFRIIYKVCHRKAEIITGT